ncbi:MAG: MBL fold metallo-hydrolase, partial [Microcystis sp. 53602_E8]|nr:MBL fold metallo-hydrolase [Microcystis sp. 53602_E8]
HNDDFLDRIGEEARKIFPETILAREGLSIELRPGDDQIDEV